MDDYEWQKETDDMNEVLEALKFKIAELEEQLNAKDKPKARVRRPFQADRHQGHTQHREVQFALQQIP